MKVIKELAGAHTSKVELVEIEGKLFVRKTGEREEIENEKFFLDTLAANGLLSLKRIENSELEPNQLLLEYLEDVRMLSAEETPKRFEEWGRVVRQMHDIAFEQPFRIDEHGHHVVLEWEAFIQQDLQDGVARQERKHSDMSQAMIEQTASFVQKHAPKQVTISHLHCDLHTNNVFLRKNGEMLLFDKGSALMAGDARYDLALVALDYFDTPLLEAFFKGYGSDPRLNDAAAFNAYILLRALGRYPNPFQKNILKVVGQILDLR